MLPPRFNIERHRGSDEETIEFLNKPAKNFFSGFVQFEKSSYKSYFRSTLLDAIISIERVIKGTFNCDIFMKNVDFNLLKQMFHRSFKLKNKKTSLFSVGFLKRLETQPRTLSLLWKITEYSICLFITYVIKKSIILTSDMKNMAI